MGFNIHIMADRAAIGATLALIAGGEVLSGFALNPAQEMISPITD
jgi:hypothetical protein